MATVVRIVPSPQSGPEATLASAADLASGELQPGEVELVGQLPGSVAMIRAVASMGGNRIITGDLRGIVRIYRWKPAAGSAPLESGGTPADPSSGSGDGTAAATTPGSGSTASPQTGEYEPEHEILAHPRNETMLAGVVSLQAVPASAAAAWGLPGSDLILSGGQDGAWCLLDASTGEKVHRQDGSDNATPAVVLSDGRIAAAATGRKEGSGYAGHCLRVWKPEPMPALEDGRVPEAALAGFTLERMCDQHEMPVRSVCSLPSTLLPESEALGADGTLAAGPAAIATVSNDGNLRLWTRNGISKGCFPVSSTATATGQGVFTYHVSCLQHPSYAGGALIAVGADDRCMRLFSLDGQLVQTMALPGVPWAVAGLPNGDIAVGTDQARGRSGHVFVLSRFPGRQAEDDGATMVRFHEMMTPPSGSAPGSSGGSGGSGGGTTGSGSLPVRGELSRCASYPGNREGETALFLDTASGKYIVCQWSATGGAWNRLGEYVGDSGGGGGGGGGDGGGVGDMLTSQVTVDMPGGSTASLTLTFGSEEKPEVAADRFLRDNRSHGIDTS